MVLDTQPISNVVIDVNPVEPSEGTATPTSLTFTPANWNTPQQVTVTGVDDSIVDGDITYNVELTVDNGASDDAFDNLSEIVEVTNEDNDTAGFTPSAISRNTTEASNGTATFDVVLTSQPATNVVINVLSDDASEGVATPASLTFTPGNWNAPQEITVTGQDDNLIDGDIAYGIDLTVAAGSDADFVGLATQTVAVINEDDDAAGFSATTISGNTTELGGNATFDVVLTSQPATNVVINVLSDDISEGVATPASLTFTPANWNTPQVVTVTGQDDNLIDGDIAYGIDLTVAAGSDADFVGLATQTVAVINEDDDAAGFSATTISGNTTELGGNATFDVVLTSQPATNVVINVLSDDASEGEATPPSLTFTSANWNTPQVVTVTGQDDNLIDGDIAYGIDLTVAAGSDADFVGLATQTVAVINEDDDAAGFSATTISRNTTELGGNATFDVVLTSQPATNVVINVLSDDASEGEATPPSLTFTPGNWDTPQEVAVTGQDDTVLDGDVDYQIDLNVAAGSDADFIGLPTQSVAVTNEDNEVAGFTVNPTNITTNESGATASFTVVLDVQPENLVRINLTSLDTDEGIVSPAFVRFTNTDWNQPQTITVTGVDDFIVDGDQILILGQALVLLSLMTPLILYLTNLLRLPMKITIQLGLVSQQLQ